RAERAHAPDDAATYYQAALAALERLLDRKGAVTAETLSDRRDAWARAYLATPHGQPVKLDNP
ncbi:MAG: nitrile hydratase accessory protein, partial [Alphaproteobacteria bacterium]